MPLVLVAIPSEDFSVTLSKTFYQYLADAGRAERRSAFG
jgi:hypothetical protein